MNDPVPALRPVEIELASTLADTGLLHDWLDALFAASPIPDTTAHAIRLCLEEAVMNVVLHGYGPGGPGVITVAMWSEPTRILARVSDTATAFDPTIPRPPRAASGVGGRGLGLMRRYAAACRYEWRDGRNLLTLEFAA